jgi:hypothetical protein
MNPAIIPADGGRTLASCEALKAGDLITRDPRQSTPSPRFSS